MAMRALTTTLICLLLSACSWVQLTPEGEKARVLSAAEVSNCQRVGATTVSVKDGLGSIKRHQSMVARELSYLARNSATGLGGDTVVAASSITQGRQTFDIYKCVQ